MDQARRSGAGPTPSCLEAWRSARGKKKFEDEMASAARETGCRIRPGVVDNRENSGCRARDFQQPEMGDKVLLIGANRPGVRQLWRKYDERIAARPAL